MQSTTNNYSNRAIGQVRPLSHELRFAFDKRFDDTIGVFTLDTSLLDGPDILDYDGNNTITEWSKYVYTNYTDRLMSYEITNEIDFLESNISSMLDVELNNFDGYFTYGGNSPIASYLLPRRPVRMLSGFGGDNMPQFVGLTTKTPEPNGKTTATVHAQDFLTYLYDRKLDQTVMYVGQRVDEILENLFGLFGVLPAQMILDVARTTAPFAYFEKEQTLGSVVNQLMKAEMGSLYMDEVGNIVFKNRLRQSYEPVYTFDNSNIIGYQVSGQDKIINSVLVKSDVREVQPRQPIFDLQETIEIGAGQTVTKFFDFQDPVTSVDNIEFFTANTQADGDGTDVSSSVDIVSQYSFGTSIVVEIQNTSSALLYLTDLVVYGTPAKVVRSINVIEKDQTSIDKFEEQTYTVTSPYIQDYDTAESIALTLVRHYSGYDNSIVMTVKGNFALQLSDVVNVVVDDIDDSYIIRKIVNTVSDGQYKQTLTVQRYTIPEYFTLDESLLNSEAVLAA